MRIIQRGYFIRANVTLADYLQDTLANVGQQMSIRKLHPNSVKIQFVLVGRSQAGAAHLQDLHAFDPAVRSTILQWPVYTHPLKPTAHRRYRTDLRRPERGTLEVQHAVNIAT